MFKNVLIASCLLVTSMASQASLISHNGYVRDTASTTEKHIVKGGGLEWLMWDKTVGITDVDALGIVGFGSGWRIAKLSEIVTLFNAFEFGKKGWYVSTDYQSQNLPFTADEFSVHNKFIDMFGSTYREDGWFLPSDQVTHTYAWFGGGEDAKNGFQAAIIGDDASYKQGRTIEHFATLSGVYPHIGGRTHTGWALVRTTQVEPAPVPLPGSLSLLALGLVALGLLRRKAFRR